MWGAWIRDLPQVKRFHETLAEVQVKYTGLATRFSGRAARTATVVVLVLVAGLTSPRASRAQAAPCVKCLCTDHCECLEVQHFGAAWCVAGPYDCDAGGTCDEPQHPVADAADGSVIPIWPRRSASTASLSSVREPTRAHVGLTAGWDVVRRCDGTIATRLIEPRALAKATNALRSLRLHLD